MKTNRQTAVIEGDKLMNTNRQTTLEGDGHMGTNRRAAVVVGVMFILATLSAIAGLLLYGPILGTNYLVIGAANKDQVLLGVFMELILVVTAIGTAVGLFPFLRKYNESLALGYLCFRFLEAVFISIGVVAVLALLTLSQDFVAAAAPNASAYQASGTQLLAVKDWTMVLGPHLMLGVNTVIYSYLLYKSRLVPRFIAAWGIIGGALVLFAALLEVFDVVPLFSTPVVLMAMPIAFYEMVLAVWLIAKGFNPSPVATRPARTGTRDLASAESSAA